MGQKMPLSRHPIVSISLGGNNVTQNFKGLMNALRQSINEALLESNDVAAAMAALRRTGKCPVFTIDIAMEEAPGPADDEPEVLSLVAAECVSEDGVVEEVFREERPYPVTEKLVLSDADVEFLASLGVSDPSWSCSTSDSRSL
jgi:hypothetical protein